ncbi:hypothetical protein BP6252_07588 [Coleophoma cylindrospora]|uniref:PNPLA domain-containing protein n=1 Tax=Coleophoma cylindrospora TaxID=1849047 RepID=A0A3D8RAH5_9HELO|nr:hypothetical protein BP6252_07588 [Coleophoma cylindrospora]
MLGRLEMEPQDCIRAYVELSKTIFEKKGIPIKPNGKIKGRFDSTVLENAIKKIIVDQGYGETELFNNGIDRGCKVLVCAVAKETKGVTRLKSYNRPSEARAEATICQAALATSAATSFFDEVCIGSRTYVDGALGANNPVDIVEKECCDIWCPDTGELQRLVNCFISLGTGNPGKKPLENGAWKFLSKSLKEIVIETEKTAETFKARWRGPFDRKRYFRFNVEQGLQDIGLQEYLKEGPIRAATEEYLEEQSQQFSLRDCVSKLQLKQTSTMPEFERRFLAYEKRMLVLGQEAKKYYEVPSKLVERFVGRERILSQIQQHFSVPHKTTPNVLILQALGGQGKSQLALKYCQTMRKTYRGIFWIYAGSEASVSQTFETIADTLNHDKSVLKDLQQKIQFVKDTLYKWDERWLLVFDNYDQPNNFTKVKDFFPEGRGDILLTSRTQGLKRLGTPLSVPEMTTEEGLELLLYDCSSRNEAETRQDGVKVIKRLGGLALAIDQAAAYMSYMHLPISYFLVEFEKKREDILKFTNEDFWEYGTIHIPGDKERDKAINAFTTWELSFERLISANQQTREYLVHFLTLSAFLNPSNIGEILFETYFDANYSTEWLQIFTRSGHTDSSNDDTSSSIVSNPGNGSPEVKTESSLETSRTPIWESESFWKVMSDCLKLSLVQSQDNERRHEARAFTDFYKEQGRYKEAEELQAQIMTTHKRHNGERHPDTLTSMNNLAFLLDSQGKYDEAEPIYQETLQLKKKVLGKEHPDTLTSMNNLASLLDSQGKSMNNLASLLDSQGKYNEAEPIYQETLHLREKVLGKEHPSTLETMNNFSKLKHNIARIGVNMNKGQVGLIFENKVNLPPDEAQDYSSQKRKLLGSKRLRKFLAKRNEP